MKILWTLLWEALRDKIILMGGSWQDTLWVRVAFPQFNPRMSPVADAMEQDFLADCQTHVFLKEIFGRAPAANL
jgi:hypothetical protein